MHLMTDKMMMMMNPIPRGFSCVETIINQVREGVVRVQDHEGIPFSLRNGDFLA